MNQPEPKSQSSIPRELLRTCIDARDVTDLLPYVRQGFPCTHDFPEVHRLVDFEVAPSLGYRVCRCVACNETIFIQETTSPSSTETGVPLDVTGAGLLRWVADERAQHEDEDAPDCHYAHHAMFDWSRYLENTNAEQVVPSDGHKPANLFSPAGSSAPADAH